MKSLLLHIISKPVKMYKPVKVDVPSRFQEKIKEALKDESKKAVSITISNLDGNDTLLLTPSQISKLERARLIGKKKMTIRMSRYQVNANLKHEGGFLGMLIAALSAALPSIVSAATAAAPAVLASAATGAISGAISKAVSGDGMYFKRNGVSARLQPVLGGGLYLSPHPMVEGDGLYLKHGNGMYGIEDKPWVKSELPIMELIL